MYSLYEICQLFGFYDHLQGNVIYAYNFIKKNIFK